MKNKELRQFFGGALGAFVGLFVSWYFGFGVNAQILGGCMGFWTGLVFYGPITLLKQMLDHCRSFLGSGFWKINLDSDDSLNHIRKEFYTSCGIGIGIIISGMIWVNILALSWPY